MDDITLEVANLQLLPERAPVESNSPEAELLPCWWTCPSSCYFTCLFTEI
jgi:hypothetical protein